MILNPRNQWFMMLVNFGHEPEVRMDLFREISDRGMSHLVYDAVFPVQTIFEISSRGVKTERQEPMYPGYLMVNAYLVDPESDKKKYTVIYETYSFLKSVPGIYGFAGDKVNPSLLRDKEVQDVFSMMRGRDVTVIENLKDFEEEDLIKITDGPFRGQQGILKKIDKNTGMMNVELCLFGRMTPTQFQHWQIEKISSGSKERNESLYAETVFKKS